MANVNLIFATLMAITSIQNELPRQRSAQSELHEWISFKATYNKSYENHEVESMRRLIYSANKLKIERHNSVSSNFKLAVNHFTDWTEQEVKQLRGYKTSAKAQNSSDPRAHEFLERILKSDIPIPSEVDWRKVPNRVTHVKDQGSCGSCWAFAAVGALEGQEILHGDRTWFELSEQNLIDCVLNSLGCIGGDPAEALLYVHVQGIMDESDYPYVGNTMDCSFNAGKAKFYDGGYTYLPRKDEAALKKVVATFGPVIVAIDSDSDIFTHYKAGIYTDEHCSQNRLDHAVLVVGYGTDKATKQDYWIVKNSWGEDWGEKGYIRIARGTNTCGIATQPLIPTFRDQPLI